MTTHPLRSRNWFGRQDIDGFAHRSWLKTEGDSDLVFDGRPVIGIGNSSRTRSLLQAHEGCDFDFLRGGTPVRAEDTAGPSHA